MLSLARSRYTHFARLGLTAANIVGVLFGVAYKSNTPDLYPGSVHSSVGWIVTCIAAAQMGHLLVRPVTKLFKRAMGRGDSRSRGYTLPLMQERFSSLRDRSGTSGLSRRGSFDEEATHPGIEGLDTSGSGSRSHHGDQRESVSSNGNDAFSGESDSVGTLHDDAGATTPSNMFYKPTLSRTRRITLMIHDVVDRAILIVAFVALCTGIATYGGLFVSSDTAGMTSALEANAYPVSRRKERKFSTELPTGSRVESFSGSASSIWAAGADALQRWDG